MMAIAFAAAPMLVALALFLRAMRPFAPTAMSIYAFFQVVGAFALAFRLAPTVSAGARARARTAPHRGAWGSLRIQLRRAYPWGEPVSPVARSR